MKKIFVVLFFLGMISFSSNAQLEKIVVEKYYVSDANDATDTTGGILEVGSVTYRIYVDLLPGSKLVKMYGDTSHALKFSSTAIFFNNKQDGQTFGKDFHKNRYSENTVALDSWITLGQTSTVAAKTYFGVLKGLDRDGSFIGGTNNDGGSAGIINGLLTNVDSTTGIPVTTSDGMDTMTVIPNNWGDYGFTDIISGVDSTIFGSAKIDSQFISYNARIQNSGVSGVNADSNQVLVAQLTTKGDLSFELNIEVQDSTGHSIKYVANDSILNQGEIYNRFLKYPYQQTCGCPDPNYLEYNASRDCDNNDLCRTLIVFGCMDSSACNYNSDANFNISSLCCYPGYCNDRDLGIVCPGLNNGKLISPKELNLFPNPATTGLTLTFLNEDYKQSECLVYNSIGEIIEDINMGVVSGTIIQKINIGKYSKGIFMIRLIIDDKLFSKTFIKE